MFSSSSRISAPAPLGATLSGSLWLGGWIGEERRAVRLFSRPTAEDQHSSYHGLTERNGTSVGKEMALQWGSKVELSDLEKQEYNGVTGIITEGPSIHNGAEKYTIRSADKSSLAFGQKISFWAAHGNAGRFERKKLVIIPDDGTYNRGLYTTNLQGQNGRNGRNEFHSAEQTNPDSALCLLRFCPPSLQVACHIVALGENQRAWASAALV
jgi:hypothetical protein